jgi:plastocyanin
VKSILLVLAACIALAVAAAAQGAGTSGKILKGKVGPGFTISLKNKSGARVKTLKAGKYTFKISDKSSIHNFHLKGPGLSKKTGVSFVGLKTWKLRLKKGKYTYVCDPHHAIMHGSFKVK